MNAPKIAAIPQDIVCPANGVLSAVQAGAPQPEAEPAWKAFLRHRSAVAGAVTLLLLVLAALFARLLFPDDPLSTVAAAVIPPFQLSAYPLGTDPLGRDVLAGLVHGARMSLAIGLLSALVSVFIGVVVGAIAGYFGGWVDDVLMRITELFQTTPSFLLAVVIVTIGGPTLSMITFAIGVGSFPTIARLVRAEFRWLRVSDFVTAARSQGYGRLRIIWQEILPNTLPPVIVTTSVLIASSILTEAGLSFLGLSDPNVPTWGSMIGNGRTMLQDAWYLTAIPGGLIIVTILAINLIGDGLNEALNPRLRNNG
ncbi:ABC transporter permease [Phyllobacterium lublinensis]|uniref:ABC transporter permease n=1 Tax=Phyllobacterium lublinensis TaxID=2875708 RepID=UPI001CCC04B7|nr:ABC transporter permease [Phyllobacterium sp. 2063]MBZ9655255.1 ABC transporter permease [Phyllobacterium sp. 2063]